MQRGSYLTAARPVQRDRPRRGVGRGRRPGFQAVQLQRELEFGGHGGAMLALQPPQHRPCALSSRVPLPPPRVGGEREPGAHGPALERRQQQGWESVRRLFADPPALFEREPLRLSLSAQLFSAKHQKAATQPDTPTARTHRGHASQSRCQGGRPRGARGGGGACAIAPQWTKIGEPASC